VGLKRSHEFVGQNHLAQKKPEKTRQITSLFGFLVSATMFAWVPTATTEVDKMIMVLVDI